MKKSYRTLEFSFIQDYIKNYCFSEMAKKRIDQIQPFQDIDDLKLYQDDISSAMKIIYAYGRIPLAPYEDIKEILQKAQKGGVCYPQDLLKIVQILKNVQEVQAYLDQEIEQSHLLEILSLLYLPKDLYNEILKCVDPSGNIYDHASHELYRLRRQISAIEANMRKKIEALRAQNKDYLSHDVISTRNDHFVLPVNVSYKNQIKGIHHGHSSSGRTTYVEPEEIVSYNNQLSQIKQDEQLEIHRILLELTKKVRSYDRVLNEDLEIMIEMDAVFAISEYGKKLDMVMPIVDENCQEIELLKARHPLIDQKEVVANDIVLKKPQDILLISGSNTGGKTVALKTAGLLSLMAICGLPIPVTQAKLPLFDAVFVDVGDEQSIEQSLSTFSSHMKRLVFITQHATKNSLVIIDEICSGTDPKEGESLADVTGLIGQYAHGNEPSHHVTYLYALAGRPERTQELVREIFDTQYKNKPDGLCGNDDCGQMSAWYMLSAMGFYPVDPVSAEYVFGAPQLPKMTLHLADGKTFTIIAENLSKEHKYVDSITLNGEPYTKKTISHEDIVKGGTLVYKMK